MSENNISVRRLPRYAIVGRLKAAGIRQADIARLADCSQGFVSRVYARKCRNTPAAERVWRVTERALVHQTTINQIITGRIRRSIV